ncbi:hypothetical protein G3M53_48110, partial [Streptomyces sp. SID7982]|nr:hypothetical protein [Streptomyces sp. SID7982]
LELALMATRTPDGSLRLRLRYDADLFDATTAEEYLAELEGQLEAVTAAPRQEPARREEHAPSAEAVPREEHALHETAAPGTATLLREIWESVLDVRGFPADSNFFDLGGNSIAAIRLVNRVRDTLGVDYPLVDF